MTTASEIKKELNAYFKSQGKKIKFSVTTKRVSCSEQISIEWVGGAFEDEVWEIVKKYHTLVDKSDAMTDYFHRTGVDVVLKRRYDAADIEFLTHCFNVVACSNETMTAEQYTDKIGGYYIAVKRDGYWLSYCNYPHYLMSIHQYNKTGSIAEYARIPEVVETIEAPKPELLPGETVDETKTHIIIHWAEGYQVYEPDAKFASFKSAHEAICKIYESNKKDNENGGYNKLKFSVVYPDGEIYEGRLDMSPREDDPTKTDNIIKTHCVEYLNWMVENNDKPYIDDAVYNENAVNAWLNKYGFDDVEFVNPQTDWEFMQTKQELLSVMQQIKDYLDIQMEILINFEPQQQKSRLQSLDQEFGIELLKRRKAKLQEKLMSKI